MPVASLVEENLTPFNGSVDLEDIEDLFNDEPEGRQGRGKNIVIPKVRTKARNTYAKDSEADCAENVERCFLPGQSRIYLKTWGCAHNSSDSEYMAGQLAAQGYM